MRIKGSRIAIAALAVASFGAASAASLGGLTSTSVGSNDTVVASCDSDGIAVSYGTTYSASAGKYQVTSVTVSGISAPCVGQTLAVTIKGTGGTSLGSGTAAVTTTSHTISGLTASAELLVSASVVIS